MCHLVSPDVYQSVCVTVVSPDVCHSVCVSVVSPGNYTDLDQGNEYLEASGLDVKKQSQNLCSQLLDLQI